MILSDGEIREYLKSGKLKVEPIDEGQIQPSSIDVRLGNKFRIFENINKPFIDPMNDADLRQYTRLVEVGDEKPFILHPGDFVLGVTREYIEIPNDLVARLEGRSSLGRLGIMLHSTAGYVDPGFKGKLTLELSNVGKMPVALYPGMRIGQLSFYRMGRPAEMPYDKKPGAKYLGNTDPEASKITLDDEFRRD